jgi:hypothetical protein
MCVCACACACACALAQDPTDTAMNSTCQAVQRAVAVVGPHGGALANAVFLQPGGHLIEFSGTAATLATPGTPLRDCFAGLAMGMPDTRFWRVPVQGFDYDAPFNVSVDAALEVLRAAGLAPAAA